MRARSSQVAAAVFSYCQAASTSSVKQVQPLLPPGHVKERTHKSGTECDTGRVLNNNLNELLYKMILLCEVYKIFISWKQKSQSNHPDLHVRNMHHISILVFGLHDHGSWPSTAYVIFVQDQRCLLGVCVRVWLQPPGWKKRTNERDRVVNYKYIMRESPIET